MRSVWSTVASIVVLAGLVGYIYFVDSKSEPNAPEVKEKVWGSTLSSTDMEQRSRRPTTRGSSSNRRRRPPTTAR